MEKCNIKVGHLGFSTNYSTLVIKIEKIVNHKTFAIFSFL